MWDLGARVFFTDSNNEVLAFCKGKTIGKFSLRENKEIFAYETRRNNTSCTNA
jgi:hypothetical protein